MGKLRVHCRFRYTRCKDLGCGFDNWDLEQRRILQSDPITHCHRYGEFYNKDLEDQLYGPGEWVEENGVWIRK
jgi:hypothetical protein